MSVIRKSEGFTRYAFSVAYHGGNSLGFSFQGDTHENSILPDGTDLRGMYSIEGRIRKALLSLVGTNCIHSPQHSTEELNFENIQVSSRTDRGVHALMNTFHVDIRPRSKYDSLSNWKWSCEELRRGLNFHLIRQSQIDRFQHQQQQQPQVQRNPNLVYNSENDIRILSCRLANHPIRNPLYNPYSEDPSPVTVDWNARFTAQSRTYYYRILYTWEEDFYDIGPEEEEEDPNEMNVLKRQTKESSSTRRLHSDRLDFSQSYQDHIIPFEAGRSWRIQGRRRRQKSMNVEEMKRAASLLLGRHDFSSFRGKGCERSTPIVHLTQIQISSVPFQYPYWLSGGHMDSTQEMERDENRFMVKNHDFFSYYQNSKRQESKNELITIAFTGEAFLYRQVRNMVGCLVQVGLGKLSVEEVRQILEERDRRKAPAMAPAHGLYLVHVEHVWE